MLPLLPFPLTWPISGIMKEHCTALIFLPVKCFGRLLPQQNPDRFLLFLLLGNGSVIIGNDDKFLYCFNAIDGKQKWKFRTNGSITGSAVMTADKVLFASTDGNVYLLRQSDGTKLWNFYAGSAISSSPAVIKDNFIILTDDGRVLSFGLKKIEKNMNIVYLINRLRRVILLW